MYVYLDPSPNSPKSKVQSLRSPGRLQAHLQSGWIGVINEQQLFAKHVSVAYASRCWDLPLLGGTGGRKPVDGSRRAAVAASTP